MYKYVIHPGFVISKNDGDRHYVTANQLIRLYGVNPRECLVAGRTALPSDDLIHLHPQYSGNYELS